MGFHSVTERIFLFGGVGEYCRGARCEGGAATTELYELMDFIEGLRGK